MGMYAMKTVKISKKEINDWLFSYMPAEKNFELFYQKTGVLYELEDLYSGTELAPRTNIAASINTDFKSIHPEYQHLKESALFEETDWIHPFMDVAIHKHPRYFPTFFHGHEFYEINYVISGSCTHTFKNSSNVEDLKLKAGDILFIPPSTIHSLSVTSDSVIVNILVRESTFRSTFLHNLPQNTALYNFFLDSSLSINHYFYFLFHTEKDPEIWLQFMEIAEEYCNNDLYSANIINFELGTMFGKLLRKFSDTISFSEETSTCYKMIPRILQYIEEHYSTCSVSSIAAHFGYSTQYLSRVFKQNTGNTIIHTLQETRIQYAERLLTTTELSVEVIAQYVGFSDQTHFIRLCKLYLGDTPAKYRNRHKNCFDNGAS